jgi:hypothetical protein
MQNQQEMVEQKMSKKQQSDAVKRSKRKQLRHLRRKVKLGMRVYLG